MTPPAPAATDAEPGTGRAPGGRIRIPFQLAQPGIIADGMREIGPDDPRYAAYDEWLTALDAAKAADAAQAWQVTGTVPGTTRPVTLAWRDGIDGWDPDALDWLIGAANDGQVQGDDGPRLLAWLEDHGFTQDAGPRAAGRFDPAEHPRVDHGEHGGEFTRTPGGGAPALTAPRRPQWVAKGPGHYQTADGQYRVYNPDTSKPGWQLQKADGRGGWDWWNTYPRKGDAQRALHEHLGGQPGTPGDGPSWRQKVTDLPATAEVDGLVDSAMQNAHDRGLREEAPDDGEAFWRDVHAQVTAELEARGTGKPGLTGADLAEQLRRELDTDLDGTTRGYLGQAHRELTGGTPGAAVSYLHLAGQSAADHGEPGLAEHYRYLARTLAQQELGGGGIARSIADALDAAPDPEMRGWLALAARDLAKPGYGQAAHYLDQAAQVADGYPGGAGHAVQYRALMRRVLVEAPPQRTPGQQAARDFAAKAAQVVPGLFGADTREAWNGQITTYQAKTRSSGGNVLAELDWFGGMTMKESVADSLATLAAGGRVRDPDAPFVVLHELIHGAIPDGEVWTEHRNAYQDRAVAHAEEGFTELGAILHAPEFFDQTGIGGRETDTTAVRDGHTVENPAWEKRQQALAQELMATYRRLGGLRGDPATRAAARRMYDAAFAVQEGRAPYLDEAIHQLTTLRDADATAAARRLQKLADAWALTDMSAKATLAEYARRLQRGDAIRTGEAWGHYGRKTAAAWAWSQEMARLDGHSASLDTPGSPGWTAAKEIADEVNRQGPDGKFDTMTGQVIARWVTGGYLRPAARREVRRALVEGWTAGPVDALYAAGTLAIAAEETAKRDTATREAVNAKAPSGPPPTITLPPEAVTGPGKKADRIAAWAWADPHGRAAAALAKLDALATPDLSMGELREVQDTARMVSRLAGSVAPDSTRAAFREDEARDREGKWTSGGGAYRGLTDGQLRRKVHGGDPRAQQEFMRRDAERGQPPAPATPEPARRAPAAKPRTGKPKTAQATVQAAIGRIPPRLRDPALRVNLRPGTDKYHPDRIAVANGTSFVVQAGMLDRVAAGKVAVHGPPGVTGQELAEWVIVHEYGHHVMAGVWNGSGYLGRKVNTRVVNPAAMRAAFGELRAATPDSHENADEAWANGFMVRLHNPARRFGPKSEAIFKELGI